MNDPINYNESDDILSISVTDLPPDMDDIFTSEPLEGILTMAFNKNTGGVLEFELHGLMSLLQDDPPVQMKYDESSGSLTISLHPDDDPDDGLCDVVYNSDDILITFSRDEVGNLTGIDMCGFDALINKYIRSANIS